MKYNKTIELKSDCDDRMFMGSEIVLEYKRFDNLGGISLELDCQSGGIWVYLRGGEIQDLINNLQTLLDEINKK